MLVILAAIASFMFAPSAHADEGNNAGDSTIAKTIELVLDVNGEDAIDASFGRENDIAMKDDPNGTGPNSKHFKRRYIYADAIAKVLDLSNSGYKFDKTSLRQSSNGFIVSMDPGVTGDGCMIVEAKEDAEVINAIPGYFSIDVVAPGSNGAHTKAYFKVTVEAEFVPLNKQASSVTSVYIGYQVSDDNMYEMLDGAQSTSFAEGKHQAVKELTNYTTDTFSLGDLLKGRALYVGDNPIRSNAAFHIMNSVDKFTIDGFTVNGLSQVFFNGVKSNPTDTARFPASLTGEIRVTPSTVGEYESQPGRGKDSFWNDVHEARITLGELGSNNVYTIIVPVKFKADNPQSKDISASRLRLNITSPYKNYISNNSYADLESGEMVSGNNLNDYRAVVITPGDLFEYACPASYGAITFVNSATRLNGSTDLTSQQGCRIDIEYTNGGNEESEQYFPLQYRITAGASALAENSFTVTLAIRYFKYEKNPDGTAGTVAVDKPIDITINTYGGYTIAFSPINGKKSVTYNALTSDVFEEMRNRGYSLHSAVSNDPTILSVDWKNNILTLDPQVGNINERANATVRLTFRNKQNQTLTFDSEIININVDAGSLFSKFEDWQAWLIIAACIVGGIIVILFIVWIFIHSLSKHKQDELAMQAPVSSYIVKLNSTIAQTQAQQRMAQTAALSQASTMLLGAGPTGTTAAPPPDTLQLATGVPSTPGGFSTPSSPLMSEPQAAIPPDGGEDLEALIAKYITDEELLERIFTEKYEPKGMVRRTFFKSKDLQTRELEKEKKRIIERYRTPMPMDEAIMSEAEISKSGVMSTGVMSTGQVVSEPEQPELFVLDFDPDSPLYVEEEKAQDEFAEEKIDVDASPEESRLRALERRNAILEKELEELKVRLDKVGVEVDKAKSLEDDLRERIAKAEADNEQYTKDIEDLEFKLASAKGKDKPIITRDIGIKEEKKARNAEELERLRAELENLLEGSERINGVNSKLTDLQTQKNAEHDALLADLEKAKAEYEAYMARLEQVRLRQELETKVTGLVPLLEAVNKTEYELKHLDAVAEEQSKERESLKSTVAAAKSQILGATDFGIIADLNAQISDANARLSDLEREITGTTKTRSDLNIEFNSQRRKANDFCEKNEIPVEEVVKAEDQVIGAIEFELVKASREKYKEDAEKAVANAQAVYDDLSVSANDVTMIAMEVAGNIKDIEDEIEATQAELDAVNAQMEEAGEDERLMLMVDQGDKSDKLEELKAKLEQANLDGTKRKMEAQAEYDTHLENARQELDRANADFEKSCASFDDFVNNTDPLDLITSGFGVISRDQKKIEAENLKKQLERSKNEIEQARLAAQQAQMEAEEARIKAQEESEAAKAEAERLAQEAIERAEQARIEAEEKARADVEAAEQARREAEEAMAAEAEEARRRAEEEAEEARRKAEEEKEEERRKAEEAKRAAEEAAEEAKRAAEEAAEEAKRKAEEEAAEAKRIAEEAAEEARRKAEEEAEEARRKAQEEIEEMKRKAEEEAEAKRLEEENKRKEEEERQKAEAERAEAIARKVSVRKDQIIAIRNEMKELKGDADAKNLRERLYNLQLTYDEDERGSSELMDFYNKTMDDIQNSGEIARLKAENAKKPQRVVRKVTERVNRIPKRKPGARGARPARPGARSARPGARPARPGARPARPGARPARPGARPPRPRS